MAFGNVLGQTTNLSNVTGILAPEHGGTGQTSIENLGKLTPLFTWEDSFQYTSSHVGSLWDVSSRKPITEDLSTFTTLFFAGRIYRGTKNVSGRDFIITINNTLNNIYNCSLTAGAVNYVVPEEDEAMPIFALLIKSNNYATKLSVSTNDYRDSTMYCSYIPESINLTSLNFSATFLTASALNSWIYFDLTCYGF